MLLCSWIRPEEGSKPEPKLVSCKLKFFIIFVTDIEEIYPFGLIHKQGCLIYPWGLIHKQGCLIYPWGLIHKQGCLIYPWGLIHKQGCLIYPFGLIHKQGCLIYPWGLIHKQGCLIQKNRCLYYASCETHVFFSIFPSLHHAKNRFGKTSIFHLPLFKSMDKNQFLSG